MIFLIFIVVGILGGTTGVLIKYAAQEVPPLPIVILRLGLSSLFLLPFALKCKIKIKKSNYRQIFLSSALLLGNILLFAIGIKHTSAIISQITYVPTSILVALFSYFFLKEKLSVTQFIGLVITISGIIMLISGSLITKDTKSFGEPSGNFFIIIALFSWASYFVVSKELLKNLSPLSISFTNTLVAFIISLIISLPLLFQDDMLSFSMHKNTLIAISASSLTSVIFVYLSQYLIKKTSAFAASLVTYINPLAATGWGILIFREKLTPFLVLSSLIVFIGVFISTSLNYLKKK